MKEADFVRLLLKNLNGVFHRNHGSRFGTAGLPDIEGCNRNFTSQLGQCVVIEAKIGRWTSDGRLRLKSPLTQLQQNWLLKYDRQGALSLLAVYVENEESIKNIVLYQAEAWIKEAETRSNNIAAVELLEIFDENFVNRRIITRR